MSGVFEKRIAYVVVKLFESGRFDTLTCQVGQEEIKAALMHAEVWENCRTEESAIGLAKFLNRKSA